MYTVDVGVIVIGFLPNLGSHVFFCFSWSNKWCGTRSVTFFDLWDIFCGFGISIGLFYRFLKLKHRFPSNGSAFIK